MQILLSNSQAGSGRTVKQEQEEISRNHVQAFIPGSVHTHCATRRLYDCRAKNVKMQHCSGQEVHFPSTPGGIHWEGNCVAFSMQSLTLN